MQSLETHTHSECKLPQLAETCQSTQRAAAVRRRFALVHFEMRSCGVFFTTSTVWSSANLLASFSRRTRVISRCQGAIGNARISFASRQTLVLAGKMRVDRYDKDRLGRAAPATARTLLIASQKPFPRNQKTCM